MMCLCQLRIAPDAISFNAVISSLEKCAQWQGSLALLQAMPELEVRPNTTSFNATISSYEKAGQWQRLGRFQVGGALMGRSAFDKAMIKLQTITGSLRDR